MTVLKQAQRSATLSFCPSGPFLAAGSVAGAIDLSFTSTSQLEIFQLDFSDGSSDLKLAGAAVAAPERFSRLCWGPPGVDTKSYPYGLIAGGLADGSVCVWNPARIIGQKAEAKPASPAGARGQMLARLQKHQGAVRGLEFNSFSPNLLASGGADGELCIWNVENPLQPALYPAMKAGAGAGPQPEITHLAWNRKVQHILGTCTAAGTVVVWDLKKQRPVISFKDPSGRKRCSALQWNPEVATQLVVASDDDMAPSLQLWDLRNSVSPIQEYHGHAKGVLAMSWCPQDSSFLLSSGKDNRTICWDVNAGELYCELPPGNNWNFDVQWAPGQLAGVFATATFEGQIALSSLSACTNGASESDGFSIGQAAPLASKTKAPSWLRRPCSAVLGFGGKLAQITNTKRQLPTGEAATSGSVSMSQIMTEPELVQRSEAFEQAIQGGDREALSAFCQAREQELAGSEEAETWAFLQTHFAADGRRFLLERLGFAEVLPSAPGAEATAEGAAEAEASLAAGMAAGDAAALGAVGEGMAQLSLDQQQQQQQQQQQALAEQLLNDDGADFFEQSPVTDGAAFFDNLASTPPRAGPTSPGARQASTPPSPRNAGIVDGPPGEKEGDIQKLLFVGNFDGAVDACFAASRHADAMVVASVVGGDLWDRARKAYMTAHPRPFMRLLHSVLSGDWQAFIVARPPAAWRETLAAILTSAPYDQFEVLLAALAARLNTGGLVHAATLCHICAGDVDAAVRQWSKALAKEGQAPGVGALEALMEKAVVLGMGVNRQSASDALSDLIVRYAELLSSNGRLGMALEYLSMIPGEPSASVAALKYRIYQSAAGSAQLPDTVAPPPFPFTAEDVSASSYQQQTAAAPAYGQQAAATPYGAPTYGAYSQQQPNGYGAQAAPPSSFGASDYGPSRAASMPPPPPSPHHHQQQQQAYGGYSSSYQPQAAPPSAGYGQVGMGYGPMSPTAAPPQASMYQPPPPQAAPAAPPPPVYTPTAAPPAAQPPTYLAVPGGAAAAPPTYGAPPSAAAPPTYGAAPAAATPPTYGAPPAAAPPQVYNQQMASQAAALAQVYQPAVVQAPAPTVYQQAPAAPASAGFQPGSRPGGSGQLPSPTPTFVPQQGPGGMAAPVPPRSGPTPTPITAPPPPPPGPPPNITLANADTSTVPAELRPVVNSITNLYKVCEMGAGGHPGKKREVEDSSKKLGALFWRMNKGEVSQSVASKLLQLCQALDGGDFVTATHLQVSLTTSDWDECSAWLTALKRLIKARHQMG
ncbi:hypothetical protein ABPG77_002591 [Micractinium sp. CCAP 211/92]